MTARVPLLFVLLALVLAPRASAQDAVSGRTLSLQEALAFFAERDITAGPVCDVADLLEHPYMADRQLLVEQSAPDGRKMLVHAAPYKINGRRPPIRRSAPTLGQDDARWLSPEDITTEESSS